jgi:hypothetical protein
VLGVDGVADELPAVEDGLVSGRPASGEELQAVRRRVAVRQAARRELLR